MGEMMDRRLYEYLIPLRNTDTQTWTTKCSQGEWVVQYSVGVATETTGTKSWTTSFARMTEPSSR